MPHYKTIAELKAALEAEIVQRFEYSSIPIYPSDFRGLFTRDSLEFWLNDGRSAAEIAAVTIGPKRLRASQ